MYKYPYGDSQQLNLDWIISKIKELEASGASGGADLEEVSNALLSLTYNTSTAYRRYDYAFLNGKLYRCLTDTSGVFNPTAWQEALIGDDLAVLTRWINAIDAAAVVDVKFDTTGTNGKIQQKYHDEYHDVVEVDYTPVQNSKRPLSSNAGYELNGAIREKHIFLMSDSYGVFAASGGESWEGFVRDYLVPRGKTVTMNATGGAGFGYQPSHADYQQCYYPNIIDGYTADTSVDMILILTGANDGNLLFSSATSETVIKTGIADSVTKLRAKFPNASIHLGFVGRYRTSNRFVSYKTARDIYKNACAENGIAFADNFEYILHNRNMINSTDLVHPTLAGSELIGKYAVEYIMRKGISVIYDDTYTIAASNTWFDWTGKKLKVKVCNETTFVTLLSSTNAYEFSFGPIQNIPVGVSVNTNETLTTEQFLLDTSILTDSTILLFALWLNTDGTTNMTLPSRVAFTPSGIFMTTVKPYAVTYPTGSTLKVINSYAAFDTMLT